MEISWKVRIWSYWRGWFHSLSWKWYFWLMIHLDSWILGSLSKHSFQVFSSKALIASLGLWWYFCLPNSFGKKPTENCTHFRQYAHLKSNLSKYNGIFCIGVVQLDSPRNVSACAYLKLLIFFPAILPHDMPINKERSCWGKK